MGRALCDDLADPVVPESPPAVQPWVIAAALTCDAEDVGVCCLAEFPVRPHDHHIVPGEVAEPRPPGLRAGAGRGWVVQPCALTTPAQAVAPASICRHVVAAAFRLVCALN